jgi:superfamily II DNA or RNA helicase
MSKILALRDYQRECIADLHSRWDAGAWRVPSVLATGLGKGHPLETEVPTPQGWRRWGDLKVGDFVFGRDGSSTEVLEIYDRGTLDAYRVTFSDESSVLVDGDHLWTVRDSSNGRRWGTLETRVLARANLKLERGYRFHVPMSAPLERPALELPLDPYVVGSLISNGSMTGSGTQLTTPDLEVAARVARATQCNKVKDVTEGICDRYSLPGLVGVTRALGMRAGSLEKRIPAPYLEGSLEQRTALLNGLMDGDGAARDSSRRSVSYFSSSAVLARDVSELVTSLGGTGIVKRYDRGAKGVEYAVRILLPSSVSAFSTDRKGVAGTSSTRNLQPKRAIIAVTLEGSSTIRCIRVAARDSLYLITRQHIVTHNTVIFSHLAEEFLVSNPGKRVLVLAHTDELVLQAARKMKEVAPHRSVGIVKAERNDIAAHVIVGSVQTLRNAARRKALRNVGLIIVDEAHHAVASTYRAILEHFGALPDAESGVKPIVRVAGFTATLARGDKLKLSDVWEECTFKRGISFGIRRGYLLDVRGARVIVPDLNLSAVKKSGGDFQDSSLAEELDRAFAPEIVAKEYKRLAGDRKGLNFVPTVEAAYHFAAAFEEQGIPSAVVHGKLAREERRSLLRKLATGEVQVVHNCAVLTEGFDDPTISCVVISRPTRSAPLYQQMVGRGLRPDLSLPSEERGDCLVLDVAGASRAHDLRSLVDLSEREISPELIDDELSLIELEELQELEEQKAGDGPGPEQEIYYGETDAEDFDPLGRVGIGAWLQTGAGTYFLPCGKDAYILLVPSAEPGLWDVAWMTSKIGTFMQTRCAGAQPYVTSERTCSMGCGHTGSQGGTTEHRELSLEMGCSWAEEVLEELGGDAGMLLGASKKRWRRGAPSDAQLFQAARRGIEVNPEVTKGELSDLISQRIATDRIDPVVQFMINARS